MAKKASKANAQLKIVPLGDRVVLKRAEAESMTAGGIVLPDAAKDKPQRGEIVAVCIEFLVQQFDATVEEVVIQEENVHFNLPRELRTRES